MSCTSAEDRTYIGKRVSALIHNETVEREVTPSIMHVSTAKIDTNLKKNKRKRRKHGGKEKVKYF